MKKLNSTTLTIIGICALAAGLLLWSNSMSPASPQITGDSAALLAVASDDHQKGLQNGPIVLVEYLDFECAACRAYFPIVKAMEEEFGDKVTFVVRYFPLSGHRNGLPAALAVEAASRQGKFWEMHDLLYARQKDWGEKQVPTPQVFEGYAEELGLNMEQFKLDVASEDVKLRVKRDLDAGNALGVQGTPTFFLQGKKISNPQSPDAFRALLQAELGA